jgi:hypothetical protein
MAGAPPTKSLKVNVVPYTVHFTALTAVKCVVTGDGAVGKVMLPNELGHSFVDSTNPITDMPTHILHDQCVSGRVHTYRVSQSIGNVCGHVD